MKPVYLVSDFRFFHSVILPLPITFYPCFFYHARMKLFSSKVSSCFKHSPKCDVFCIIYSVLSVSKSHSLLFFFCIIKGTCSSSLPSEYTSSACVWNGRIISPHLCVIHYFVCLITGMVVSWFSCWSIVVCTATESAVRTQIHTRLPWPWQATCGG